jgi:glycosyltransferase involved in cell wall biosynthesis
VNILTPLVSVIVPVYNREHTIAKAIKSIQNQTFDEWEAIIVDDCSTDGTVQIVKRMAKDDYRIRIIVHVVNRGAQAARNTGIKAANGTWLSFLDSDDEWLPDSLSIRIQKALMDKVAVVHSGGYILTNDNKLTPYRIDQPSGNVYGKLLAAEGPMFQALLVSKNAMKRIGYLDEKIVSFQEWDTHIRLARLYLFGFVPEPTYVYDSRTQNAISRYLIRAARGYAYVVEKHFLSVLIFAGPKALANHFKIITDLYAKGGDTHMANIFRVRASLIMLLNPITTNLARIKNIFFSK